jgi:TolA-binding protein
MKCIALTALAAVMVALPASLPAQQTAQDRAYQQKRAELQRDLEETQRQLADLRNQRVQLQARIENVIANMLRERAQTLLLSNETTALQQLDAMLTTSQDALLAQRERFLAVGDAVRRRAGSVLVVLLRADSAAQGQALGAATLQVDNAQVDTRSYTTTAQSALQQGALDQLYRANVLPTGHTVTLQLQVNGQPLTQSVSVNAAGESVTYVQFAVRGGQLVPTTWTSRGTTPF